MTIERQWYYLLKEGLADKNDVRCFKRSHHSLYKQYPQAYLTFIKACYLANSVHDSPYVSQRARKGSDRQQTDKELADYLGITVRQLLLVVRWR